MQYGIPIFFLIF